MMMVSFYYLILAAQVFNGVSVGSLKNIFVKKNDHYTPLKTQIRKKWLS
jgi:hypothetical protein